MSTMWELTKKCWKIASDAFPNEKGVLVDIPCRLGMSGSLRVLSSDGKELGDIAYKASVSGDSPFFVLSLKDKKEYVDVEKFASMSFPAARKIDGAKVMDWYGDNAAEPIAALAAASGVERTEERISQWILANGFAGCDSDAVLEHLGVTAAKRLFENMEKIRINNPSSMEHQEGGRIMKHKRMDGGFIYLVLVDGSSYPKWFAEEHLSKNTVGEVPYRTSLPRTNAE